MAMISTKGRYALRIMLDLATHQNDSYISLFDIAQRQNISEKYLESIVAMLNKAGLLDSSRGKNGGYRLNRTLDQYTIYDIIQATEGPYSPVPCIEEGKVDCNESDTCLTINMWVRLSMLIDDFFKSITIKDLLDSANTQGGKE